MLWKYSFVAIIALVNLVPDIADAQSENLTGSPLDISFDHVLADDGTTQLEFGLNYNVLDQRKINTRYQSFLTQGGRFIDIPINVSTVDQERRTLVADFGFRYGLTSSLEIQSSISALHMQAQGYDSFSKTVHSSSETQFSDFSIRLSQRMGTPNKYPASIGFFETSIVQNSSRLGNELHHFKSFTFGATAYFPSDPLLLVIASGYKFREPRKLKKEKVDPGNTIFLHPSVSFAVNNEISLSGGVSVQSIGRDKVNGLDTTNSRTQADAIFGLSFGLDQETNISFETKFGVIGDETLGLSLNLSKDM